MERENINVHNTWSGFKRGNKISWGAVFAGALIAVVLQLTFSVLGFGIGIGTLDPMDPGATTEGLGIGSLIYWVLTNLISIFIGAYVAGRLASIPKSFESMLHGVTTWGVYSLFSFFLLTTTVGTIISGVGGIIGQTMEVAGAGLAFTPEDIEQLEEEVRATIEAEGEEVPEDEEMQQEIRAYGQEITQAASRAGIFMGISLILGAVVSAFGGKAGKPDYEIAHNEPGPGRTHT
ncbi:hypothetical protein RCC89_09705 [Cytophagaceae bacterium ABcell3]|nr:hypothetical protein RCC89_09705 [Cytophagaceae bacterium ABcell3]